ncbi:MAG: site-2 protease family protein [Pirellulaceae bacterium]
MDTLMIPFAFLDTLSFIAMGALGLGVVIFVHELGHFLVAKINGVKCEKFFVGFDVPIRIGPILLPRALFRKKIGETEYGIGIIPLGGYVKMLGQDDNPANAAREAERIRAGEGLDPRSYPAKSVPQRMAIISAGVIMNLIFAVIFAMVAYRMGVTYTPCVIGTTSPGLSAWRLGLSPGDQITQIGAGTKESEFLRFDYDLRQRVALSKPNSDIDLKIRPIGQTQVKDITANLSPPQEDNMDFPMIGLSPLLSNVVAILAKPEWQVDTPVAKSGVTVGDKIIEINGQKIADDVDSYIALERIMAQDVDRPWKLKVERTDAKTEQTSSVDLTIEPMPYRDFGFGVEMGPIAAIQEGSPAAEAGLRKGDLLISINGQPIEDAMLVQDQLRRLAGQSVAIGIRRTDDTGITSELSVDVMARDVTMTHRLAMGWPIAADAIGVAFQVTNRVQSFHDPKAAESLQVGDQIQEIEFIAADEAAKALEQKLMAVIVPEAKFETAAPNEWTGAVARAQGSLPGTKARLTVKRGSEKLAIELPIVERADWFAENRGLMLRETMERMHQVTSLSDAFALGLRETKEGMANVFLTLKKLVSRQVSPKHLGGPLTIFAAAGAEASFGFSRLLIFLTVLSANLAILNSLPIPVLDGGHFMFLLYEGVFRRPVNERIAFSLTMVGLCFILGLMFFVIGMDVMRFTGIGS